MALLESWDVVIVGAGSAGLAAGIYAVRSGLKTLILDEKFAGGTISDAPTVVNYPGFAEISGGELAQKMTNHARKLGAVIRDIEPVIRMNLTEDLQTVTTPRTTYEAKAVVICQGSHYKEIGVKGERELRGKGVSYCGVCDGPFFKGKRVLVVGGGNTAATTILYLSDIAREVVVVHRRGGFRAEESLVSGIFLKPNVKVMWNTEVQEIKGEKQVKSVALIDNMTQNTSELTIDAVFVQIGEAPNSQLAIASGVEADEHGYIKVDFRQQTNLSGVFAAGDITNQPVKQVGTAVGQGITAALEAYSYIRRPYYRK
jgi:thioredoxin reductase (NADPH)